MKEFCEKLTDTATLAEFQACYQYEFNDNMFLLGAWGLTVAAIAFAVWSVR